MKISEKTLRKIVSESVQSVLGNYDGRESDDQESLKGSVINELRMFLYQMISGESFTFPNRDNTGNVTTNLYWKPDELQTLKQVYSSIEKLAMKY